MGALGYGGSAASALYHRDKTGATSVLCIGMAFGISQEFQRFGDVLVSQTIFPYDRRDVVMSGEGWIYEYPRDATTFRASRKLWPSSKPIGATSPGIGCHRAAS